MSPEAIQRSALLDILFEHRNKSYGAYELRTAYSRRLTKGIAIAMLVPFLLYAAIRFQPDNEQALSPLDDDCGLTLVDIVPPPPPEPPQPEERTSPTTTAAIQYTDPDIVPDNQVTNPPPKIDDLQNKVIADFTRDGDDFIGIMEPPPAEKIGPEYTPEKPAVKAAAEEKIFSVSEKMPEFPGGKLALQRFLSRNMRSPNEMEPGQKVKLVIRFVVDENGNVGSFVFTESGEPVYQNEILRVMKKMPKWIPGEQNGAKVRVYFHIPVVFATEEE